MRKSILLLALFVCGLSHPSAQIRGPLWLLGKTPDRNPYGCTASTTGTYVGPSASITDAGCAVWTLGAGTTPNIAILRNGAQACGAFGAQIEWFSSNLYVQGDDLSWYLWNGSCFDLFGTSDPSGGGATPTGYFVATTGDDSRSCMTAATITTPKRTIASGMACPSAGDTLYVRAGTYNESFSNPTINSGTSWNNVVTIKNYPGETVWVTPSAAVNYVFYITATKSYIVFDGINLDASATVVGPIKFEADSAATSNPHHLAWWNAELIGNKASGGEGHGVLVDAQGAGTTGGHWFKNLTVHAIGGNGTAPGQLHAFYLKARDVTIENCNIYDYPGSGIQLYAPTYLMSGTVIRNNVIHDSQTTTSGQAHWGIVSADGSSGASIYNNVIYGVTNLPAGSAYGIDAQQSSGNAIYNNTVTEVLGTGVRLYTTSSANALKNNIVYNNASGNIDDQTSASTASNLTTDPSFVNSAAHNYHIQAGSAARDVGVTISSVFTTDIEATPRPQGPAWDIGAYEYH